MLSAVLECTGGVTVSPARALGPSENFSHFYKLKKKKHGCFIFFLLNHISEFEECAVLALSQMHFQFHLMFSDFLC